MRMGVRLATGLIEVAMPWLPTNWGSPLRWQRFLCAKWSFTNQGFDHWFRMFEFQKNQKVMDPILKEVNIILDRNAYFREFVSQSYSSGGTYPNGSFTLQKNWKYGWLLPWTWHGASSCEGRSLWYQGM